MTVTLRVTSKLFKLYDLQITILKIDSVNCKHIGRDVTHTIGALHQLKLLPLYVWHAGWLLNTIRYDTRCYFNVRSKADINQLNLPHGTDN